MKKSCLYIDKKYKCVSFIVHYKGLTLIDLLGLIFTNFFSPFNISEIILLKKYS